MEWGKTLGRAAWDLEALPGAPVKGIRPAGVMGASAFFGSPKARARVCELAARGAAGSNLEWRQAWQQVFRVCWRGCAFVPSRAGASSPDAAASVAKPRFGAAAGEGRRLPAIAGSAFAGTSGAHASGVSGC